MSWLRVPGDASPSAEVVALHEAPLEKLGVVSNVLFNLTNRMASGLDWVPNPGYEALGR